ncbi:hypothetical protein CHS0354_017764 [Potamilus streckersoni]|uniref:Uncharacterized protein n=1 Tax=Potamilus streckersoni TaxID=2493646 RepID=A0AAE0T9N4_9BIVA|nr:hypothetical protein CHS0354_017764 [Potamilus streckersoni]
MSTYAKQAWSVVNVARVNEDPKDKLIQELRAEIEHLRLQTGNVNSEEAQTGTLAEIVCLRDQLKAREKEMEEMTRSWQERLKQSEERKLEESKLLEVTDNTAKTSDYTAGVDAWATLLLGMVQLLGYYYSHLAGHEGVVTFAVSTVVTVGEEDTGKFHTPGEDKI